MPVVVRSVPAGVQTDDPRRLSIVNVVEEEQFQSIGVSRVDAEVDAVGFHEGSERVGTTGILFRHAHLSSDLLRDSRAFRRM
jgi:hypothetical protein